jgi:cell division transport system ATP-binding protein
VIRLTHVSQRYGAQVALDDVNLEVNAGDFCVVLGPSGAGKTSLLRLLTMEALPISGQVQVGSFVSGRLGRGERAELRRTLGVVFEDFKLLEDRNLFENVALALRIHGIWDRATLERRVDEALAQVGLPGRAHAFPRELSAGQKQRAGVARAIVNRPHLVLADEPTGNLDPAAGEEILDLLFQIHRAGTTILLATNNQDLAGRLAARGARLVEFRDGSLVEGGRS